MWKRHPLTKFAAALSITGLIIAGLFLTGLLDPKFWADSHAAPQQINGIIQNLKSATYSGEGHFDLVGSDMQTQNFEINAYISTNALRNGQRVAVNFSPNLKHVYFVQILSEDNRVFEQDKFEPLAWFQPFQTSKVLALLLMSLLLLTTSLYALLALTDWLIKPRQLYGAIQVRLEQTDYNSDLGIVVRPFAAHRKNQRFFLNQRDFLQTDGAGFVCVQHTPFFNYVKQLQVGLDDLSVSGQFMDALKFQEQPVLLHYLSRWHFAFFFYADLVGALALLGVIAVIISIVLPVWSEPPGSQYQLYGVLLPSMAMIALVAAVFLLISFLRKWRDVRRPKKLTEGPVLSKWRVNGVNNENLRQIVVADGGFSSDSEAVHKFDVSVQIFDELKIGDIIKIEHTPRLRFILRMEIIGHQELELVAHNKPSS